jgi:hypothetical protein
VEEKLVAVHLHQLNTLLLPVVAGVVDGTAVVEALGDIGLRLGTRYLQEQLTQ